MKRLFPLVALFAAACGSKDAAEQIGAQMLNQARQELNMQHYDAARDTILSLRKNYPTALKARAAAILLLDSIEICAAQDSVQTAEGEEFERLDMKAKFFQRKLEEDMKK